MIETVKSWIYNSGAVFFEYKKNATCSWWQFNYKNNKSIILLIEGKKYLLKFFDGQIEIHKTVVNSQDELNEILIKYGWK